MGGRDPRRLIRLTAALAGVVLAVIACGGISSDAADRLLHQGDKGVVKLAVNPWVGYEANAAVITYLLEHELGYRVDERNLKEEVAWQGFETGEVDVVVENWGHDDLKQKYIETKKVAVEVGPTGNTGIIGWYVPAWMTREYAGITDWRNLNRYAGLRAGRRLRHPELAGGVRCVPRLPARPAVVLLRHPQRDPEDDPGRRHRALPGMVFITHDLSEALKLGDRIAIMRDGELVQVGRPEDLVGAPADDYVADFVRDVPKSHVLTVRWIARPARPGEPLDGPTVTADTVIRDVVDLAVHTDKPVCVLDGTDLLGVVDRVQILSMIAGRPEDAS